MEILLERNHEVHGLIRRISSFNKGRINPFDKNNIRFKGELKFDESMPDGTPRNFLDGSFLSQVGWSSGIGLKDGLQTLYSRYRENNYIQ